MIASSEASGDKVPPRRLAVLVPLAVFAAVGVVLAVGLTLNPREVHSALIAKLRR
ncbi:MAG: hypothetical protein AB7O31_09225 [Burkholderiales bacterium]